MREPFTKQNVARMAERAAGEIESLRRMNERLAPKAHAYDTISTILRLLPQELQGAGIDVALMLRKRAAELRQPKETDEERNWS